jgi:hypothetical protein
MVNPIDAISSAVSKCRELITLKDEGKLAETEAYLWSVYEKVKDDHDHEHIKCEILLNLLVVRAWMQENGIETPIRNLNTLSIPIFLHSNIK